MRPLAFRNVDTSPEEPVASWPNEAIQAALERGGLSHWRRLSMAIGDEPWGPVARRVEEVLRYSRPYGVANLMGRIIEHAREQTEQTERKTVAREVSRLIERSGLPRAEFASRIGTSPSRLSTYATGKVTPSATLMLRMRRLADGPTKSRKATATMKRTSSSTGSNGDDSPSKLIDARIEELGDWRGEMLARIRALVKQADLEVVEEWKWRGVPVWYHDGIICTGETYKEVVKMTFAKGASLDDPSGLFNSSLEGNTRRAIDIREGEEIDEEALKELIRAAVALNESSS